MKRSKSFTVHKRQPSRDYLRATELKRSSSSQRQPKKQTPIPDQIKTHIDKHLDVEIITYYQQYKQQFFLKAKKLQQYLYKNPSARTKYITEENAHFKYAFVYLMLDLYRKGVIVPGSHDNLRIDAVRQIQKWMLSWIQRKMLYQKYVEEQKQQIIKTCSALTQLEDYVKMIEVQELPF